MKKKQWLVIKRKGKTYWTVIEKRYVSPDDCDEVRGPYPSIIDALLSDVMNTKGG